MVKLIVEHGLPFCSLEITYRGRTKTLDNVLVDTGSADTIFKMDKVDEIGITIEDNDIIESISGIGGSEFVYKKSVDNIRLGSLEVIDFTIEVGAMDYGFDINGILGMDFLRKVGAIMNLDDLSIYGNE